MQSLSRPQQQGTPPVVPTTQAAEGAASQMPASTAPQATNQVDRDKICLWIVELASSSTRENALSELRFVISITAGPFISFSV